MNLPLERWHIHLAAIQAIDQAVGLFLGFLGGEENDGAVSFQLKMCLNANFKIVYNYSDQKFIQFLTQHMLVTPRLMFLSMLLMQFFITICYMSANLQYNELISLLHHFGSCHKGVHQEQIYISRLIKLTACYYNSCFACNYIAIRY